MTQLDHIQNQIKELERVLADAHTATSHFTRDSGVSCKVSCGACCMKPNAVWSTIAEMLPLAWHLYQTGRLTEMQAHLVKHESSKRCALFQVEDESRGLGRCSVYQHRPLVCRLFGSSARRDKDDTHEVLACQWQHAEHRDRIAAVERAMNLRSEQMPVSQDWSMRLHAAISDETLSESLPINEALREAIARIDFITYYQAPADLVALGAQSLVDQSPSL